MICSELQEEGIIECYKVKREKELNVFEEDFEEEDVMEKVQLYGLLKYFK